MSRLVVPVEIRFWRHVTFCPNTGCWPWVGSCNPAGYGHIMLGRNKKLRATRLSWTIANGLQPPEDMHVLHKCDVPMCVNPGHLFLGTQSENMIDKVRKNRHHIYRASGSRHPMSKLTEDDVVAIRASSEFLRVLADRYGVTMTMISNVRNRRNWTHV